MPSPLTIRLGQRARQRIAGEGMQAADVAIIPAAAGGPIGLILHGLGCWLFGDWLRQAPRQRYPAKVDAAYVSRTCRALLDERLDGRAAEAIKHPGYVSCATRCWLPARSLWC